MKYFISSVSTKIVFDEFNGEKSGYIELTTMKEQHDFIQKYGGDAIIHLDGRIKDCDGYIQIYDDLVE